MSNELVNRAETAALAAEAAAQAAKASEIAAKESQEAVASDKAEVGRLVEHINNDQLVSIQNSKEAIRQAIVNKGQECGTDVPLADYAGLISNIDTADFSEATPADDVNSGDLRDGKKLYNGAGELVIGALETVTELRRDGNVVYAPEGIIDSELSKSVGTIYSGANPIIPGESRIEIPGDTYLDKALVIEAAPAGEEVSYGYLTDDGKVQVVDLSNDTVVNSGSPITMDVCLFELPNGVDAPTWTSIDLSFVTATSSDILAGKVGADANGNPVNGTIQTVSLSVSGNVVSVGKGFTNGESVTIPEATAPSVSGNVVTFGKGYNATEKKVTVGTAREATTITPSVSWKQIPANTYCVGAQYIAGDENLIPENIAEGVSIFNVQGTHRGGGSAEFGYIDADGNFQPVDLSGDTPVDSGEARSVDLKMFNTGVPLPNVPSNGGGSMDFYKCASVDTSAKTWTGYKAVLTDGVYIFAETITEGLKFSAVTPKVGAVYSADALGEVKLWTGAGNIPAGVPTDGLLAWYPLTVNANDAFGGRSDSIVNGNVDFSNGYATGFSTSNYIQLPGGIIPNGQNEWTVGFLIKKPERTWCHDLAEVKGSNEGVAFHDTGGWYHIQQWDNEWTAVNEQPFDKWLLLLIANKPSTGYMVVYTNGSETRATDSREISINNPITVGVLNRNGNIENATPSVTQIKHIFFYGKALSASEVSSMYQAMSNTGELDA